MTRTEFIREISRIGGPEDEILMVQHGWNGVWPPPLTEKLAICVTMTKSPSGKEEQTIFLTTIPETMFLENQKAGLTSVSINLDNPEQDPKVMRHTGNAALPQILPTILDQFKEEDDGA